MTRSDLLYSILSYSVLPGFLPDPNTINNYSVLTIKAQNADGRIIHFQMGGRVSLMLLEQLIKSGARVIQIKAAYGTNPNGSTKENYFLVQVGDRRPIDVFNEIGSLYKRIDAAAKGRQDI
jgi:hypothetical protein